MTRHLGVGLRWRVIEAVEEGVSAREAARRVKVGISTAMQPHTAAGIVNSPKRTKP